MRAFAVVAMGVVLCGCGKPGGEPAPQAARTDGAKAVTVRVAAVQCASEFGDPAANRQALARRVADAADHGAKIVVLPETAVTGYMSYDIRTTWRVGGREVSQGLEGVDPSPVAETVPGPSTEFFGPIAARHGIYLTVPLLEADRRTGQFFNTSLLLGPDGRVLIHYRKRNPWPWAEKGWATDGDLGNPVADTPYGRLGVLICFDIHRQATVMREKKIDILLYSIAWVDGRGSTWYSTELPGIARAGGFHIVAANWTVPKEPMPQWYGYGQSRVIDSGGNVLAKADGDLEECTVYADLPCGAPPPPAAPASP